MTKSAAKGMCLEMHSNDELAPYWVAEKLKPRPQEKEW